MPKLYVVGTPIGNLEDMTLRAIRILKEVDIVLCEDTRLTRKLLSKYEISTKTLSYSSDDPSKSNAIIEMLRQGKNLALVSDAGTPAISDPGSVLVKNIKEALRDEVEIVTVPGPSALTAFLSIAGLPVAEFTFLGFLPHKKGRETLFKEIALSERAMVFYESPHRILKTLESLKLYLHDSEKTVIIGRELTKVYEEVLEGSPEELLVHFKDNPEKVRGEFVVLVG